MVETQTLEIILSSYTKDIIEFLPTAGLALLVGVLGYILAKGIQKSISRVFSQERLERYLEKIGWGEIKAEIQLEKTVGELLGSLGYWATLLLTFVLVFNILGFEGFSDILQRIVLFVPNVIVAGVIFGITALLANITESIVRGALIKSKISYAHQIGTLSKLAVWVFGVLAGLSQLRIAPEIIHSLFQGIIGVMVISLGLAFGLGGVDTAKEIWKDIYKQLKGRS